MKRIIYLLLLVVVVLAGCKSSKHLATSETKTSNKGSDIQLPGFQASVDHSRQEGKYVCRGNHEDENS